MFPLRLARKDANEPRWSDQRAIEAAFTAEPSRAFTVEALVLVAFRGVNRVEKKHRVSCSVPPTTSPSGSAGAPRRAAHRRRHHVLQPCRFAILRGGTLTAVCVHGPSAGQDGDPGAQLAALDDPQGPQGKWRQWMEPGRPWWEEVEIERCRRSGDHARADELDAKLAREAEAWCPGSWP